MSTLALRFSELDRCATREPQTVESLVSEVCSLEVLNMAIYNNNNNNNNNSNSKPNSRNYSTNGQYIERLPALQGRDNAKVLELLSEAEPCWTTKRDMYGNGSWSGTKQHVSHLDVHIGKVSVTCMSVPPGSTLRRVH